MVEDSITRIKNRANKLRLVTGLAAVVLLFLSPLPDSFAESMTSQVSIYKGELVKISNVDDWFLGAYDPAGRVRRAPRDLDYACVFSASRLYSISFSSANNQSNFQMMSRDGVGLDYTILVTAIRGNRWRNFTIRDNNTTLTRLRGSLRTDCSDVRRRDWNIRFRPLVNRVTFNRAAPGIYQDQVTLVVRAE